MASLEQIGTVTTRSGGLIVIDTGYLGIWSSAFRVRTDEAKTVPVGESLPVLGERMAPPDQSNWKRVLVRCKSHSISRSEKVLHVGVDYARLLIADFDVLGAWHHEDSLDGLADFVFGGL